MITQDLIAYIQSERGKGKSDDDIHATLVSHGWNAKDVTDALLPNATVSPTSTAEGGFPDELRGWNWGAALLSWIWGIRFHVWISFLAFVPVLNYVWWVVLGVKGNEWAWEHGEWKSVEEFKNAQHPWKVWGFIILGFYILLIAGMVFFTILPLMK